MALKQIISTENTFASNTRPSKRALAEAKFERLWLIDQEQFKSNTTSLKRDYFSKIIKCFPSDMAKSKCVDLGSGDGSLSRFLSSRGAEVTAVDIATTALKQLAPFPEIKKEQHFVPYTSLPDNYFDYVLAINLIAELPEQEYRLFFSELVRLVEPNGSIIVSTPLDINSEDALKKFIYLAETELSLESLIVSYQSSYIRFIHLLKKLPTFMAPLVHWIENRDFLLRISEKITQFLYDQEGISYVILIAKRRPLFEPPAEEDQPIERKGKKLIWE